MLGALGRPPPSVSLLGWAPFGLWPPGTCTHEHHPSALPLGSPFSHAPGGWSSHRHVPVVHILFCGHGTGAGHEEGAVGHGVGIGHQVAAGDGNAEVIEVMGSRQVMRSARAMRSAQVTRSAQVLKSDAAGQAVGSAHAMEAARATRLAQAMGRDQRRASGRRKSWQPCSMPLDRRGPVGWRGPSGRRRS